MERTIMKINIKRVSLTLAIFVDILMLVVGLSRLIWPDYAQGFVEVMASLYPGYTGAATVSQTIIGSLYGAVDGAICGAVFGCLYNCCSVAGPSSNSSVT